MRRQKTIPLSLLWFSKETDQLVGEEMICVNHSLALKLVKEKEDPAFVSTYEVDKEIADNLQPYFNHQIEEEKYAYEVCSYGNYRCRNGVPVKVPYDLSWYHKKIGLVSDEDP